jgi:hypothetical protein
MRNLSAFSPPPLPSSVLSVHTIRGSVLTTVCPAALYNGCVHLGADLFSLLSLCCFGGADVQGRWPQSYGQWGSQTTIHECCLSCWSSHTVSTLSMQAKTAALSGKM